MHVVWSMALTSCATFLLRINPHCGIEKAWYHRSVLHVYHLIFSLLRCLADGRGRHQMHGYIMMLVLQTYTYLQVNITLLTLDFLHVMSSWYLIVVCVTTWQNEGRHHTCKYLSLQSALYSYQFSPPRTRYHKELFNLHHAMLRNVVEHIGKIEDESSSQTQWHFTQTHRLKMSRKACYHSLYCRYL